MSRTLIEKPAEFFLDLGGLHDTWIEKLDVNLVEKTASFRLNNLNANFGDLTEYPDRQAVRPATLLLEQTSHLSFRLSTLEGVRISDVSVDGSPGAYDMRIALNLGGVPDDPQTWWICCCFGSLSLLEDFP